jgi:hypothetical protein
VKPSHTVRPVFDEPNLVSAAGLVPVFRLAESAGLYGLLDALTVASPNATVKAASVLGGMLAGADSIDDLDLLRHGGMCRVFAGVRAPSTLGTFLRSFSHGHVQQLDQVNRRLLAGLRGRVPGLMAGGWPGDRGGGLTFIDVDDSIREVHGHAKQGAAVGYTRVRGLNVQLATISSPAAAPVIAGARLRRGNIASFSGAARLAVQAIGAARDAGATGRVLVRADSAYFGADFVAAVVRHDAWYSVTARLNPKVKAAIASIPEQAWTPISYTDAVFDEAEQRWVSDAEVAEVPYTTFTRSGRPGMACRLVVRRVKPLRPIAGDGTVQGELFAAHRHHAFITNSTLSTIEADERHRDHAIIEQVIAELKDGPLAHLPSGSYPANAAWVALAVIAFNIARAAAVAAGQDKARWASLRTRIINIPARIATTGRRLILHLPQRWPWGTSWQTLWATATGPPTPATS